MWYGIIDRGKHTLDRHADKSSLQCSNLCLSSLLILSQKLLMKHVLLHARVRFLGVFFFSFFFPCAKVTVHMCVWQRNNFNSFLPRSVPSLCYAWNEWRPSLAVPSADSRESRSLCGSRGGTKTFPLEELWVPVDKEGSVVSPGRVYMLVYSGVLRCSRGLHLPDNKWWLYK